MRSFLGVLRAGDNGLYVSTGGFTNDAKMEAGQSHEPVKMLDRDGLIKLTLEHYETMEPEFQSKVPLWKVWVPAGIKGAPKLLGASYCRPSGLHSISFSRG